MKILFDENTPVQVVVPIRQILGGQHTVDHVDELKWKSKLDKHLIPDARQRGYDAFVTKDSNQLSNPDECDIIKKSGIHHIRFKQGEGRKGLARAMASLIAAVPDVVEELSDSDGQRLVRIQSLSPARRHETTDPSQDPPPYWK